MVNVGEYFVVFWECFTNHKFRVLDFCQFSSWLMNDKCKINGKLWSWTKCPTSLGCEENVEWQCMIKNNFFTWSAKSLTVFIARLSTVILILHSCCYTTKKASVRMRQCSSVYFRSVVGTCSLEHWQKAPELTYRIWKPGGNCRFDRWRALPRNTRAQRRYMEVELSIFSILAFKEKTFVAVQKYNHHHHDENCQVMRLSRH